MRKTSGWQTCSEKPDDQIIDTSPHDADGLAVARRRASQFQHKSRRDRGAFSDFVKDNHSASLAAPCLEWTSSLTHTGCRAQAAVVAGPVVAQSIGFSIQLSAGTSPCRSSSSLGAS